MEIICKSNFGLYILNYYNLKRRINPSVYFINTQKYLLQDAQN